MWKHNYCHTSFALCQTWFSLECKQILFSGHLLEWLMLLFVFVQQSHSFQGQKQSSFVDCALLCLQSEVECMNSAAEHKSTFMLFILAHHTISNSIYTCKYCHLYSPYFCIQARLVTFKFGSLSYTVMLQRSRLVPPHLAEHYKATNDDLK